MINITNKEEFKSIIDSNNLVLVDFWAEWCQPCLKMMPELEKVEKNTSIKICKINVEENRELTLDHLVRSIPTMILFQNGEIKEKFIGVQKSNVIIDRINELKN